MNYNSAKLQTGGASVELVLISPVILSICYLLLEVADFASLWEQRIVASRNAAYRTELYNSGEPNGLDQFIQDAESTLGYLAILSPDQAAALNLGNRVKRYSISENSNIYRDLMIDSRSSINNRYMSVVEIKQLSAKVEDQAINNTTGIGWSLYESPVGILRNMFLDVNKSNLPRLTTVLKEKHAADFASVLDLSSTQQLCLGYDNEMRAFLNPENLYTTVFPKGGSKCKIPPWVDIPNIPPIPNTYTGIFDIQDTLP